MKFVDSHCHLDFAHFDEDRQTLWNNCQEMGVEQLIIPGVNPGQWQTVASISAVYDGIYHGVGLHPWWVQEFVTAEVLHQQLMAAATLPRCVAIGECGLDAMVNIPLAQQLQVLEVHLQVADELSLPVIIHCRKTHNDMILQLKKYRLKAGGVIHAFSGSSDLAQQYWSLGFYLGIGGTISYERANKARDAVKKLPLEALLLETDAPDMPLQGKQGQRNSPENIPQIARILADLRGQDINEIAAQTTRNSRSLFKINN